MNGCSAANALSPPSDSWYAPNDLLSLDSGRQKETSRVAKCYLPLSCFLADIDS